MQITQFVKRITKNCYDHHLLRVATNFERVCSSHKTIWLRFFSHFPSVHLRMMLFSLQQFVLWHKQSICQAQVINWMQKLVENVPHFVFGLFCFAWREGCQKSAAEIANNWLENAGNFRARTLKFNDENEIMHKFYDSSFACSQVTKDVCIWKTPTKRNL